MTKIKFDYAELQRSVVPSLNSTVNNLSTAIRSASSMDVPYGFRYYSELQNLSSYFSNQSNKLRYTSGWISSSNNKYQSAQNELNAELEAIDNVDLKIRTRRVI